MKEQVAKRPLVRVAIVGGGCAGMTAAWYLARKGGYDVHVYEAEQHLGGKGASTRDEGRVLEHGLHVWLGFYENAFRVMRDCYAEVQRMDMGPHAAADARLAHGSFDDAFFPEPHIGVGGRLQNGDWALWSGMLPPAAGEPGTPIDTESNPFTLAAYMLRCVTLVKTLMLSVVGPVDPGAPGAPRPDARSGADEALDRDFAFDPKRSPSQFVEYAARLARTGGLGSAALLLQAVTIVENWLRSLDFAPQVAETMLRLLEAIAGQARKLLRDVVSIDEALRWKSDVVDIVLTIAVGLYRDRVLFDKSGFDAINGLDYREWLLKHGATRDAVNSSFLNGIYELVFAFEDGDPDRPALAAGVALRGALRMFCTYRGAMFWRMRSGMGDVVFAPLYRVLGKGVRRAGDGTKDAPPVTFHLCHTLTGIEFDKGAVSKLTFTLPADRAIIDSWSAHVLDTYGGWPQDDPEAANAPFSTFDLTRRTEPGAGDDQFDAVVLALGIDSLRGLLEEGKRVDDAVGFRGDAGVSAGGSWQRMFRDTKTVATQVAQLWLEQDLRSLGWRRGTGLFTALGLPDRGPLPPMGTWADMTHVLASERRWRTVHAVPGTPPAVRSVAYFCAALPDGGPDVTQAKVEQCVTAWLESEDGIRTLWPGFDAARRERLYVRANTTGSERYTLSLPGTLASRVSPLDGAISNMTIAGDWTANGLDVGCIEAAVMSGMLAAHALTGDTPALEDIVGYDHP